MLRVLSRTLVFLFLSFVLSVSTAQKIDTEFVKKGLAVLASDEMGGRKPGTPGGDQAAKWICEQFQELGLQMLGEDGLQYFDVVTDIKAGEKNRFSFGGKEFVRGTDYSLFSFSSNGPLTASVVFVGYGFDFEKDTVKWNDYEGVDVKGKWVMMLRGNPDPENDNSIFDDFSKDRSKVLTAKDKGAAGVLFVNGAAWDKNDELVSLYYDKSRSGSGIPVINIKRALADSILAEVHTTVVVLESDINKNLLTKHAVCKSEVTAYTDLTFTQVKTANVVAMIPGAGDVGNSKYIVVGAHYDHLGMGGIGSGSRQPDVNQVHNGADDNASGVMAVLELARMIKANAKKFNHSILFIAFGAEEMGLLGSSYFVSNPLIPIDAVNLMLNFDMVGRFDDEKRFVSIGGTGTFAEAEDILAECVTARNIKASYSKEGYGPSDHAPFYSDSIPVLYFNTGVHEDYHTPADDVEKVNVKGIWEVSMLAELVLTEVDNLTTELTYREAGPKAKSKHGGALKVRLGIMPDFANTEVKGVAVGAVTVGGPAEHGGIHKGDVITALNGKPVENIYDYMDRLKTFTSGQTISVDVLRGKDRKVLLIQL